MLKVILYANSQYFFQTLTFVLLNPDTFVYPAFANSIDPDQLVSEEVSWSGSALFVI